MGGHHPFQGRWCGRGDQPAPGELIRRGAFVHASSQRLSSPPPWALPFDVLPPILKGLFLRAFRHGHHELTARPSAREWSLALDEVTGHLTVCPRITSHLFSAHLKECPWCLRMKAGFSDYFVSSSQTQTLAKSPTGSVPSSLPGTPAKAEVPTLPPLLDSLWRLSVNFFGPQAPNGVTSQVLPIRNGSPQQAGSSTRQPNKATKSQAVIGDGLRKTYHRPSCKAHKISWRYEVPMTAAVAYQSGFKPCRVCNPALS